MSVGYMKDGSFVKLANVTEINVEIAARQAADQNLQDQIDKITFHDYIIGNDGTYYVYTLAGLQAWAAAVEASPSTSCILMSSIDMAGVSWTPLCVASGFSGFFDGAGHILKNLKISAAFSSSTTFYAGFFGSLAEGGQVRSLNLEDINIGVTLVASDAEGDIGGIAGAANGSNAISCCSVSGSIYCFGTGTRALYIGGLVGKADGADMLSCVNSAEITSQFNPNEYGQPSGEVNYCVGGIAGMLSNGIVKECSNAGAINGMGGDGTYNAQAGGIIGYGLQCLATACANTANVYADYQGQDSSCMVLAGSIAGLLRGTESSKAAVVHCAEGPYVTKTAVAAQYGSTYTGYAIAAVSGSAYCEIAYNSHSKQASDAGSEIGYTFD